MIELKTRLFGRRETLECGKAGLVTHLMLFSGLLHGFRNLWQLSLTRHRRGNCCNIDRRLLERVGLRSVAQIEMLAALEGISLARRMGFAFVELESDSLQTINLLN
ncbi:unnamed protein product [Malus baccata var. baccata]